MKTVIILIDGAFLTKKYESEYHCFPTAGKVQDFATKILDYTCKGEDHSLIRIYYYDCPPLNCKLTLPISKGKRDLSKTDRFRQNNTLINELKRTDFFSVREGFLSEDGWLLKPSALKRFAQGSSLNSIVDSDFKPNISQKGVDMKIGLDIAWISLEKIAQRIILVTGDSDFIPAIKFARRSGIQVFLATLHHGVVPSLLDHADCLFTNPISSFFT